MLYHGPGQFCTASLESLRITVFVCSNSRKLFHLLLVHFSLYFTIGAMSTKQDTDLLIKSLEMVMQDDSFKVNSPATIRTRKSAEEFLKWCRNNERLYMSFAVQLKGMLEKVIAWGVTKSFNYN